MVMLPRKFRDIVFCVVLVAFPILLLWTNVKDPTQLNPLDHLVLRVSAPIQELITSAFKAIHRSWFRYVYLVNIEKENEQLKRENRDQRYELIKARRKLIKLSYYEKLLQFRKTQAVETVGVRVISRNASPYTRALRVVIDRGDSILRPGLPVVIAEGVVGRIGRVFGGYADVVLAVDPQSRIDVVIQRTGSRGLLRGLDGTNRYLCRLDYVQLKEDIKVGDMVVTSGVAGLFPKELPVGRISRTSKRSYSLYQEVEVEPYVNFTALEEMLVIVAPPPPSIPAVIGVGPRPAHGFVP